MTRSLKINYTISTGASIKIGYRPIGSSEPFTYIIPYPTYLDSPFTVNGLDMLTNYEFELTQITSGCTTCIGNAASKIIQETPFVDITTTIKN